MYRNHLDRFLIMLNGKTSKLISNLHVTTLLKVINVLKKNGLILKIVLIPS